MHRLPSRSSRIATSLTAAALLGAAIATITTLDPTPANEGSPRHRSAPVAQSSTSTSALSHAADVPLGFETNRGQFPGSVVFAARDRSAACLVDDGGFTLTVLEPSPEQPGGERRGVNLRFEVDRDAPSAARVVARGAPRATAHYYIGNDPSLWARDVPTHTTVSIVDAAPGVDVDLRWETRGRIEYDLAVAADADLAALVLRCDGATDLDVIADGRELLVHTALGTLRQDLPGTWQTHADGSRELLDCRFRDLGEGRFGFEVADRDPELPLLIDPGLIYSTFLGGSGHDNPLAIDVLPSGSVTVAGHTTSLDFPSAPGPFVVTGVGFEHAFVSRLSADGGTLLWSSHFGGSGHDGFFGLDVAPTGEVAAVGHTLSPNFPITSGAFSGVHSGTQQGLSDGIVVRLDAAGGLVFSTTLGAESHDVAHAVAFAPDGAIVVGGYTRSAGFPVTPGAYDTTQAGGFNSGDAFIAKLAPTGAALVFATFLGGAGNDAVYALELDALGRVVFTGFTEGFSIPPGSWNAAYGGAGGNPANALLGDALVGRLAADGSSLEFAGLIGGSVDDAGWALALADDGSIMVVGDTRSSNFPTTAGVLGPTFQSGTRDAFACRISADGAALIASTYLGGSGDDVVFGLALAGRGAPVVAGRTSSANFPTTAGAFQVVGGGSGDGFVVRLAPDLTRVEYGTYVGASGEDAVRAMASDGRGGVLFCGHTLSAAFPTTPGAFDLTYSGGRDGFVGHLDLLPAGVTRYGDSTAGCSGALVMGVGSVPAVGNLAFSLTCLDAPSNSVGFVGFSPSPRTVPLVAAGARIWIDPIAPGASFLPAPSGATGFADVSIPIPQVPVLAGTTRMAQFVWLDPCAPAGISASDALALVVQ